MDLTDYIAECLVRRMYPAEIRRLIEDTSGRAFTEKAFDRFIADAHQRIEQRTRRDPQTTKALATAFIDAKLRDPKTSLRDQIQLIELQLKLEGIMKPESVMGAEELAARIAEFNRAAEEQGRPQ